MRGPKLATAWARDRIATPGQDWTRLCLKFVRSAYGLPAVFPTADAAWSAAQHKHETKDAASIPAGVPVFWSPNHVALSIGRGRCISTDAKRRGKPDIMTIDSLTSAWNLELLGWTEDLNGTRVWSAPAAPNRVQQARSKLRQARRLVRDAHQLLDDTPEDRTVVHNVSDSLDKLIDHVTRKLERLPKS